ncbi:MAG: hypothetical protein J6Y02_02245 [Pseudobutyrivibrio sp.]|nr:hypothetical protein [Pseudobutyrivibrio sp.]
MTREANDQNMEHLMETIDTVDVTGLQGASQAFKASCDVEKAHIEQETKKIEVEAQKEIAKKQRIVDWFKTVVYFIGIVLGAGVAIWNSKFVSREEHGKNPENEAILMRSKAWFGMKPLNFDKPRL